MDEINKLQQENKELREQLELTNEYLAQVCKINTKICYLLTYTPIDDSRGILERMKAILELGGDSPTS